MSSKLTIAVDLDDVVVQTAQNVIDHYNSTYGTNIQLDQYYSHDVEGVWGVPDRETAVKRVNSYLDTEEYFILPPVEEAIGTIRALKKHHNLHIVTGRPDFTEAATQKWLANHFPDVFESVVFTGYFMPGKRITKSQICRQLEATVLIDDHLDHAWDASAAGIDVLLFGSFPWNQSEKLPPNITRVADWPEVARYFNVQS